MDPSDSKIKSCLSLVIVSNGLEEYVESLLIDENRIFTPHRAIRKKLVFTDHYSLILKFRDIQQKMKWISDLEHKQRRRLEKIL